VSNSEKRPTATTTGQKEPFITRWFQAKTENQLFGGHVIKSLTFESYRRKNEEL